MSLFAFSQVPLKIYISLRQATFQRTCLFPQYVFYIFFILCLPLLSCYHFSKSVSSNIYPFVFMYLSAQKYKCVHKNGILQDFGDSI